MIFQTSHRTETPEIMRLDLVPHQPKFAEDKFEELFKPEPGRGGRTPGRGPDTPAGGRAADTTAGRGESAAAAPPAAEAKPPVKVEIDYDNIRRRVTPVATGQGAGNPVISPDGKYLLITGSVAGQTNLYLLTLDEDPSARAGRGGGGGRGGEVARGVRQLTSTPGPKSRPRFSADSREVYFLENGRVQAIGVENRQTRSVDINAEMDVDFQKEKMAVFEQAWAGQRDGFYDPKFHGADWNKVRQTYAPLIEGCRTPDEMRAILRLMVGELNSSHSGISAPQGGGGRGVVGQIG